MCHWQHNIVHIIAANCLLFFIHVSQLVRWMLWIPLRFMFLKIKLSVSWNLESDCLKCILYSDLSPVWPSMYNDKVVDGFKWCIDEIFLHFDCRWAFVDLSAGPFSWGPSVGGVGVRTEHTLPSVDNLLATLSGNDGIFW